MGIRLGQLQIKDIRFGTKEVIKVYNKEQQIYSNTQEQYISKDQVVDLQ